MNSHFINIGQIIDKTKNQQKLAIIDFIKGCPRFFNYDQLDSQADFVSCGLKELGIVQGDKVAIVSENCFEFLVYFFGIMRLGAIAVLINKKLTSQQISAALHESESKLIFTDDHLDTKIKQFHILNDYEKIIRDRRDNIFFPQEDSIAFILYTSGSVNDPKGALIRHSGHSWAIARHKKHDATTSDKRIVLISSPLYHANGLTTTEGSIAGHSTIILLPKFDADKSIDVIKKYKVNTLYGIPTMLSLIVQQSEKNNYVCDSVREIRMASAHVTQKLYDKLRNYFPKALISNNYGITEVGPGLFGQHPDGIKVPPRSVGYPAPGIEYRIIDGVLQIKSPSMIRSYISNAPPLTDDGFFITNDLFSIDEQGFYYFEGRADDMFKCGGNRVYPKDIEFILDQHPCVNESFVIALPDEIKGHKPYAFVVLQKGKQVTEKELKNYCLENMPAYQHPRRIWFLNQLPLAGTNKIAKKELLDLANDLLTIQQ